MKPTSAQEVVLDFIRLQCQRIYNAALEQRRDAWRKQRKTLSLYEQQTQLTVLRIESEYGLTSAWIQRSALTRVDRAYKAFFRRVKAGQKPGFPRFKSHARYDGFGFPKPTLNGTVLQIPSFGAVKLNLYRPIRGVPLEANVTRDAQGKWWVGIACELGESPPKVSINSHVGIDVGLSHFATFSDGSHEPNPRFYRESEALIARRNRALAHKKQRSNARTKAKRLLSKAHTKVRNQRLNHARHLAKRVCAQYDLISVEALKIQEMIQDTRFAKSIGDVAWRQFIACLNFKAEEAGKTVTAVEPRGTSQRCSRCHQVVKKTLWERVHKCTTCGLVLDRDHNAALNILALGLSAVSSDVGKPTSMAEILL
jgi:putative transposase